MVVFCFLYKLLILLFLIELVVGLDWNELKKMLNFEFDWDGVVKQVMKLKYLLNKVSL